MLSMCHALETHSGGERSGRDLRILASGEMPHTDTMIKCVRAIFTMKDRALLRSVVRPTGSIHTGCRSIRFMRQTNISIVGTRWNVLVSGLDSGRSASSAGWIRPTTLAGTVPCILAGGPFHYYDCA